MALDGRLSAAAELVTPGGFLVDVGTDHGYLPVYLAKEGKIRGALATDVNLQPLQSAEGNIAAAGVEEKVKTQLADGLTGVSLEGVTDLVLAGMGGMLIAEILEKRLPELYRIRLILQPMTQAPFLRQWLCTNGLEIRSETPAEAGGKSYTVIEAYYTGKAMACSELFAHVGKIPEAAKDPKKREAAKKYLKLLNRKLQVIAYGMKQSGKDPEGTEKFFRLAEAVHTIEEGIE